MSQPARFYSFWAVNGPLELAAMRRQLAEMKTAGFDGVVFHPRFYPNDPPYMSAPFLRLLSEAILFAQSIALSFWIYDENGWPSGIADGQLLKRYPDDSAMRLELVPGDIPESLVRFSVNKQLQICQPTHPSAEAFSLLPQKVYGIDCLNPGACRHFLALTHERYRTGLSPEAFAYVEAFFSDEPEFGLSWGDLPKYGAVPWTSNMLQLLHDRVGNGALERLPLLFFDAPGAEEFRVQFWELATDLFCAGFLDPYQKWVTEHGKCFTMHVKGEEHPLFQVPMVGSCHQAFQHVRFPGIDALERDPSNDYFPRQVASAAAQFGNGRSMVECFGGAGWGAGPADLERYLLWLGRNGLTDFVLHLNQYRLNTAAIRDWPPSQPTHLSWREAYPEVLVKVRRQLNSAPIRRANTLLIAPYRGIMASYTPQELLRTNIHNAATYPATAAGNINARFMKSVARWSDQNAAFHVADERSLEEHGQLDGQKLALGHCRYDTVVAPSDCMINAKGAALLANARAAGIKVCDGNEFVHTVSPQRPVEIGRGKTLPPHQTTLSIRWRIRPGQPNALVLDSQTGPDEIHRCSFLSDLPGTGEQINIILVDDVTELSLNGQSVALTRSHEGFGGKIATAALKSINEITFRTVTAITSPIIYITGCFHVFSCEPFLPGPNGTVRTAGPFVLQRGGSIGASDDLVQAGYPFLHAAVMLEADISCPEEAIIDVISFTQTHADAGRLWCNGQCLGWQWGEMWSFAVLTSPADSVCRLQLELVPSSFNFFGPHHHIDGDRHVVSPGQYAGRKNFADRLDAPEVTRVPDWHFKPLIPPAEVTLQGRCR